jgi:hypothetical protein
LEGPRHFSIFPCLGAEVYGGVWVDCCVVSFSADWDTPVMV